MKVELENLTKRWGNVIGAESVDLEIEEGEFVAFLGPSGCGKTTTLLMIAGIYKPTAGVIRFDGRVVNSVPPRDRNIGMVFQSYALYPHMTVFQNISYPLKLKKMRREEIQGRVQRTAEMMGIADLLDRKPAQLSGGQQQRVALGRALIKTPGLLLFDEPLSNLDARLRLVMRREIKRLQTDSGITSIYVTHDQVEAMTMADRIVVMKDGGLEAYDTPDHLYDRPKTLFVAEFVGNPPMNFVDATVSHNGHAVRVHCDGFGVTAPSDRGEKALNPGEVVMGIRPEDVAIADTGISGEIAAVEPLGRDDLIDVQIGDVHIHALADPALNLKPERNVKLKFNTNKLQFFNRETGRSLLWSCG